MNNKNKPGWGLMNCALPIPFLILCFYERLRMNVLIQVINLRLKTSGKKKDI